jgi:hypothetical protein
LRTILQVFWNAISREPSSLFDDFFSFARLSLADAAELVEASAGHAKETLRKTDEEVQRGERDTLGRDKERLEQEQDPKVAFAHGMDTLKDAGTSVIGTGQEGSAKASEMADRVTSKYQDSFYRVRYYHFSDAVLNTRWTCIDVHGSTKR